MYSSGIPPTAAFRKSQNEFEGTAFECCPPESGEEPDKLRINVLFTTPLETQFAMKRAVELSEGLNAEILLIVPQIVPFPLEIDSPPVPLDFASEQLCSLLESVDADLDGAELGVDHRAVDGRRPGRRATTGGGSRGR